MPKNIKSKKAGPYVVARLQPGDDLKESLSELRKKFNIQAGSIICSVGSLRLAKMRLAQAKTSKIFKGPFEILCVNGTIGVGGIHCHLSIANKKGQTFGGHLMDGCIIQTTCELIICLIKGFKFNRTIDPNTGYKELSY